MPAARFSAVCAIALSLCFGPGASDAEARDKSTSAQKSSAKKSKNDKKKGKSGRKTTAKNSATSGKSAKKSESAPKKPKKFRGVCRLQRAKNFLKRDRFVVKGQLRGQPHQKALKWRIEQYGKIEGVPFEKLNPSSAFSHAKQTRFMGLPVLVHEKIVPAIACVEKRIKLNCNGKGRRYSANAIGGFRQANTYRQGEVSNHLFGIAVDIDPGKNPCCGCVDPWPNHPSCRKDVKAVIDKAELTQCWVDAFERYGFYWLGRDALEDTMHFEFLGDPDRIIP
jgi:hypothetical protein